MGDWLIQTLCMMGSVIGVALLVSMIRRDGYNELRGFYIFMGLAAVLIALLYIVADSRQKSEEVRKTATAADVSQSPELIGKVVRVLDGDTFELLVDQQPVRIRVTGIDAPEKDQPFGQRSRQSLAGMVDGNPVAVRVKGKDRFGRTLGAVYAKICAPSAPCLAVYVNAEQVKTGMAWAYRFHGQAVDPAMLKLETQARSERVGLWSAPNAVEPWKWRHQMVSAGK
ncbi:thermonuclease family protein [Escherichia coli]|uniref:thermonuclease family protein n=1 Tax=Escherichia coli TaxID=562 RepID=UPI002ED20163|nr:thermonuclease family protein [Escherichia coli]MEE4473618.1 thermonuclease family protein [Escherichia coli]